MSNLPERQVAFKFSPCDIEPPQGIQAETFIQELQRVPENERMAVVRTWMQDKSPAAFSSSPYLWEAIRDWLAKRHEVSPRQIGLAGSAQLGFSTSPKKPLALFDRASSDLDLYIVSEELFLKLEKEAAIFIAKVLSASKSDYKGAAESTQNNLRNSYVDTWHIPAKHDLYPHTAKIKNDTSILLDKLKLSGFALKPSHFRIYKDWDAKSKWTGIQARAWVKISV